MNMKFSKDPAGVDFSTMQQTSQNIVLGKRRNLSRLATVFVLGLSATGVWAAQPPDPTNSDSAGNTAGGTQALNSLNGGSSNTAFGDTAQLNTTSGTENSAFGYNALARNTTGYDNTAVGVGALGGDIGVVLAGSGNNNTSTGAYSLTANQGNNNTATGYHALEENSTGNNNIGVGYQAGLLLTTGSNNIDIGNQGVATPPGYVDTESNVIRIGTSGTQTATYIAGISGVTVTGGADVVINSSGQLGTVVSSAQYKKDIQDMGDDSAKLALLRPVTFHYKADPTQQKQYGLVAEEVAKIYPDLAVRDADGKVQSVQYHQLIPMLVNEMQRQQRETRALKAENASLRTALEAQKTLIEARLTRLEQASHPEVVANR